MDEISVTHCSGKVRPAGGRINDIPVLLWEHPDLMDTGRPLSLLICFATLMQGQGLPHSSLIIRETSKDQTSKVQRYICHQTKIFATFFAQKILQLVSLYNNVKTGSYAQQPHYQTPRIQHLKIHLPSYQDCCYLLLSQDVSWFPSAN